MKFDFKPFLAILLGVLIAAAHQFYFSDTQTGPQPSPDAKSFDCTSSAGPLKITLDPEQKQVWINSSFSALNSHETSGTTITFQTYTPIDYNTYIIDTLTGYFKHIKSPSKDPSLASSHLGNCFDTTERSSL